MAKLRNPNSVNNRTKFKPGNQYAFKPGNQYAFKPGVSGNPGGQPSGKRLSTRIMEMLDMPLNDLMAFVHTQTQQRDAEGAVTQEYGRGTVGDSIAAGALAQTFDTLNPTLLAIVLERTEGKVPTATLSVDALMAKARELGLSSDDLLKDPAIAAILGQFGIATNSPEPSAGAGSSEGE